MKFINSNLIQSVKELIRSNHVSYDGLERCYMENDEVIEEALNHDICNIFSVPNDKRKVELAEKVLNKIQYVCNIDDYEIKYLFFPNESVYENKKKAIEFVCKVATDKNFMSDVDIRVQSIQTIAEVCYSTNSIFPDEHVKLLDLGAGYIDFLKGNFKSQGSGRKFMKIASKVEEVAEKNISDLKEIKTTVINLNERRK